MPPRLLPLVALLLVLAVAAFWWLQSSEPDLAASPDSTSDTLAESGSTPQAEHEEPAKTEHLSDQELNPSNTRVVATSSFQSTITSPEGELLSGVAYWLEANEELILALETEVTIGAGTIWKKGRLETLEFESGELALPLADEQVYFCWIEVDGYRPFTWFSDLSDQVQHELAMEPCPELKIQVTDASGSAVEGAAVSVFRQSKDDGYPSLDWRGKLERRYFQTSGQTNAEGVIKFASLPDMLGTIWVKPDLPYGLRILDGANLAEEHLLEVSSSMTIRGRVVDSEGKPIQGVLVVAFQGSPDNDRAAAGEAVTDENGEYFAPGVACTGLGNSVVFYKEYFDPHIVTMPFPRVGQDVELNAALRAARPIKLQFVTPQGDALTDIELAFSRGSLDWIPALPKLQEDGTFHTHMMFVPGEEYAVAVRSMGLELARVRFVAQDNDSVQDIVVPGAGRLISETPAWLTGKNCVFNGLQNGAMAVTWPLNSPSPWLPTGPGYLTVESVENGLQTIPVHITEGNCDWPNPADAVTLHFSLDILDGEAITLRSTSAGGEFGTRSVTDGANVFLLSDHLHDLKFTSSMRGDWVLGRVPESQGQEIDLGHLVWPAQQNLRVKVQSEAGDPVVNSLVTVSSASSTPITSGRTDRDGYYQTGPLNSGLYQFKVIPYASSGTPLPVVSHIAYVGPESDPNITINYGTAPQLEVALPASTTTWEGLLLQGQSAQAERSTAASVMRFQGTKSPARWLVWRTAASSEIYVASGRVEQATGQVTLPALSNTKVRVDSMEPGSVILRLAGRVLTRQALRNGGELLVQHTGSEDLTLQWIGTNSVGPRVSLAELSVEPRLPTSATDWTAQRLHVVDETGAAIPSVNFALPQEAECLLSNREGIIQLEKRHSGALAHVSRPGYFPEQTTLSSDPIVLRRLTETIEIECSQSVPVVRLEPLFELSLPLAEMHTEMTGTDPIRYKKLPAGRYRLTRWTESGTLHSESEIVLEAGKNSRVSDGL